MRERIPGLLAQLSGLPATVDQPLQFFDDHPLLVRRELPGFVEQSLVVRFVPTLLPKPAEELTSLRTRERLDASSHALGRGDRARTVPDPAIAPMALGTKVAPGCPAASLADGLPVPELQPGGLAGEVGVLLASADAADLAAIASCLEYLPPHSARRSTWDLRPADLVYSVGAHRKGSVGFRRADDPRLRQSGAEFTHAPVDLDDVRVERSKIVLGEGAADTKLTEEVLDGLAAGLRRLPSQDGSFSVAA
jgi:hypothetical protein